MKTKEEYMEKLKSVQLVSIDVDGTMTDGKLNYLPNGDEFRSYHAHDGIGILLLQALGIKTVLMTTGTSDVIARRGGALKMDYVETNIHQKDQKLMEIAQKENIHMEYTAHIGDDINDVPAFQVSGLAVAVENATKDTLAFVDYQLSKKGGDGAVRAFAEDLYKARNIHIHWDIVQEYFQKRQASQ